jgi:hypothetical protein
MSMIAFPAIVFISNYTDLIYRVCQMAFERMLRSRQRPEKAPKDKLGKSVLSEHYPVADDLDSFHVGNYANT